MKKIIPLVIGSLLFLIACSLKTSQDTVNDKTPAPLDSIEGLARHWYINQLIGSEFLSDENNVPNSNGNQYTLSIKETEERYTWGNQVIFNSDNTFRSYYTAPCGVDCFPSTFGRYVAPDSVHIQFYLDSISIHGMTCEPRDERISKDLGLFTITRADNAFIFTRVTE